MPHPEEVDEVAPGILVWQVYDAKVKADLFSAALATTVGTYLIDPTPVTNSVIAFQTHQHKITGIFVTNENHARAAEAFAEAFSVPVYVHELLRGRPDLPHAVGLQDGGEISGGLVPITIDGGPAGEMALHYRSDGGTMIVGDALINFEPNGFSLLPAKYCLNHKQMLRSLAKILDYSFERMLFAHGTPILSDARARVEQLLARSR